MKYLNQTWYPEVAYPTNVREPDSRLARSGTVSEAGCGLCCMCMVVDLLTTEALSLEECIALSIQCGANRNPGTDLDILAAAAADRFQLHVEMTSDPRQMLRCLQTGGVAVVNVGGNRAGYTGLYSHNGHYVLAVGYNGTEVCVLDPSWSPDKFTRPDQAGLIRVSGYYTYCAPEVLIKEAENRDPSLDRKSVV